MGELSYTAVGDLVPGNRVEMLVSGPGFKLAIDGEYLGVLTTPYAAFHRFGECVVNGQRQEYFSVPVDGGPNA